ncbi:MAG: ribosome-associated translation inhibitor RaiA [Bdellovibrionaceae bacterium]|nr:ribosome-associated translation inhibitor RaiA [Pseudobdellovibrionaceae bacterium]
MFYYQIDFSDCDPSDAVRFEIERHLQKLDRLHDRIIECHVSVRIPHRHQRKHTYHINLQLKLPGKVLVVDRDPDKNDTHTDIKIAIRDAFAKLTRQLEDYVRQRAEPTPAPEAPAENWA